MLQNRDSSFSPFWRSLSVRPCPSAGARRSGSKASPRARRISLYIGFTQGGGYDTYARTVARFLGKHVPGNPTIRAAADAWRRQPRRRQLSLQCRSEGRHRTSLRPTRRLPVNEFVEDPAVEFHSDQFNWIGNANADVNIMLTWHASGIKTIDDARAREVTMGATAPAPNTSALYPRLTNTMLHTKMKIVTGYPGGADIDLAMERGELDGRGSDAWATLKATRPEWVRDQKVNILMQIGFGAG